MQKIKTFEEGTNVQVMFLTDGDGDCYGKNHFKDFLKE
jgi:hypothetical protein